MSSWNPLNKIKSKAKSAEKESKIFEKVRSRRSTERKKDDKDDKDDKENGEWSWKYIAFIIVVIVIIIVICYFIYQYLYAVEEPKSEPSNDLDIFDSAKDPNNRCFTDYETGSSYSEDYT